MRLGEMFVTPGVEPGGPRWIINSPTKKHWRYPTKAEWVWDGLQALKSFLIEKNVKSVALPPLGCGNGGLDWALVRPMIEEALSALENIEFDVYEPTRKYHYVANKQGVEKLTIPRALIAEMIRRYELLGFDCSLLEIHKIAWFLKRMIRKLDLDDVMDLRFEANRYGPYANRLEHLLNSLDGSYLSCDKRLADATAEDTIRFNYHKRDRLDVFLKSREAQPYVAVVERTDALIDGFQNPVEMEALATVDWLISETGVDANLDAIKEGIRNWPAGPEHAKRKEQLFSDKLLNLSIERLKVLGN